MKTYSQRGYAMIMVNIKQLTACFSMPTVVSPQQMTYPLPPPSTIYGFLRTLTGNMDISYKNTALSIQGSYETKTSSLERVVKKDKKDIVKFIVLFNCNWIVHIKSTYEEEIEKAIIKQDKLLRLGRREDFVIDISVKRVKTTPLDPLYVNPETYENGIYLKTDIYKKYKIPGHAFRMSIDTEKIKINKNTTGLKHIGIQTFIHTKIKSIVQHAIEDENFYMDEYSNIVGFLT